MVDRERLALVIQSIKTGVEWKDWTDGPLADEFRKQAHVYLDHILADIADQGLAIVPVEPTEAMISFGVNQAADCTDEWTASASCIAEHVWAAMLSARGA